MSRSDLLTVSIGILALGGSFVFSPAWAWPLLIFGGVLLILYVLMGLSAKGIRIRPWVKYTSAAASVVLILMLIPWHGEVLPKPPAPIPPQIPIAKPEPTPEPPEQPPAKATKRVLEAAVAKKEKVTTAQPPAPATQTPTVINNAPSGIANSGTIGQAVVNNYAPPERHLNPMQAAGLDQAVSSLPDSLAEHLIIETTNDAESACWRSCENVVF